MVGKYQVHRIISNMRRKYVFEERQWKKGIETAQLTLFRMGIFRPALESLKICSINLVIIFIMSAKMATPGFLKIMVFWNKGYDVISYVDDVTNKILPRDSNYIVDVFMWPKFGNCSISMREVITTSILKGFDQKNHFFWGVVLVQTQ